ncbi:hypothetical protein MRB53_037156 [Persea americana]|nr:hypothetical protein MRB53_037156 [Persea americana]
MLQLASLEQTSPTHPTYLAWLHTIDHRRDEKIRWEEAALYHRTKTVEKRGRRKSLRGTQSILSDGATLESDRATVRLRFQWEKVTPNRPADCVQQRGINTLRHRASRRVPSAPQLKGAAAREVDDDLSAMKDDEVAAKEQFLRRTPWANPRHPANQHALLEHQARLQHSFTSSTPNNQRWMMSPREATGGSQSTLPPGSDDLQSSVTGLPPSQIQGIAARKAVEESPITAASRAACGSR